MLNKNDIANYLLELKILEKDIDTEEEKDWIEAYLSAFHEDIKNIEGVISSTLSRRNNVLLLMIMSDLSENKLKKEMKVFFIRDQAYIEFISIEIIN